MPHVSGILLAAVLVLAGCGGDGVSGSVSNPPPIVWDDPQDAVESFDYLGRFYGLGVDAYPAAVFASRDADSDSAGPASYVESVTLDGLPADVTELRAGQIVEIHGASTIGASPLDELPGAAIDIKRAIVGIIENIDADSAWLSVLGQRVYVYDAAAVHATVGDTVAVYGHLTADGQVLAALVEPYVGDPLFLVRGVLNELGPNRFSIGGLEVDISNATREKFPGGAPLPGDSVLVLADQPPVQGSLTARTVRCVGACEPARWEEGLARGFLTGWRSSTDFDIDGIAIRPSWCECGYGPPPPLGSFVDVSLYGGNAELYLAPSTTHRIGLTGSVTAIDTAAREIVVLGFRVQASPATQITATTQTYPNVDALAFDELQVGDAVEVSGEALGKIVVAGTIVRQGSAQLVRTLEYTLNEPGIEVAGQTILTDGATQVSLCEGQGSIGVEDFFAQAWNDQGATLLITVDPGSAPLVAQHVAVCMPEHR